MKAGMDDLVTLSADVGGTNLNLGLVTRRGGVFQLLLQRKFPTAAERSLHEPVLRFLEEGRSLGIVPPAAACVSGAGPVQEGRIVLTNAPWGVDGPALEQLLGIPVQVVNDFTALSHGVLLLNPGDPDQLRPIPHPDGSHPAADPDGTVLIVGAGTGLGVGCVVRGGGPPRVLPSEGGHIGLPITGEATLDLWRYLRGQFPGPPGAESAVSGPGLAALLSFLVQTGRVPKSASVEAILARNPAEQPEAIATGAAADPACGRAMDLFVELYARVCADLCTVFLPTGGLFLAGGIAAKNEQRFLANDRFMRSFESNYRGHINTLVRATPIHIVRDYNVSLYGAADLLYRDSPHP